MEMERDPEAVDIADDDDDALSFRGFPIHDHDQEPDAHSRDDDPCSPASSRELFQFCTDMQQKTSAAQSFGDFPIHDRGSDAQSLDDSGPSRDELFQFYANMQQKTRFAHSFRDFPIHDQRSDAHFRDNDQCSRDELFQFGTDLKQKTGFAPTEIVLCRKVMSIVNLRDEDSSSIGRSFLQRSDSFMRNQRFQYRSASQSFSSTATESCGNLRSNSRRPKVLIGLAKMPSMMELSEIRKRQARHAPAPMFPVVLGENSMATICRDGDAGEWSLLRALRYRSLLLRVLTKAASGCIPRP